MITYIVSEELNILRKRITGIYLTGNKADYAPKWLFCYLSDNRPVTSYISLDFQTSVTSHMPNDIINYIPFPNKLTLDKISKSKNYDLFIDFKRKYNLNF